MDESELERLRARYADTQSDDIHDPHFKAVAEKLFEAPGKRPPPFAGLPTFLDFPYREDVTELTAGRSLVTEVDGEMWLPLDT